MKKALLVLLVVFSAIYTCPSSHAAETVAVAEKFTYVIVHGATGGGWTWKTVDRRLSADGHLVYRPTLTGVGERVHLASPTIRLSTHIDDIVNVIHFEDLRGVVLIGHSYGGMVATGVLDRIPERIRCVVFLDAALPDDGESFLAMREKAEPKAIVLTPNDYATGYKQPPDAAAAQPIPHPVPHPLKTYTDPVSFGNPAAKLIPATSVLFLGKKEKVDEKETVLDAYHQFLWDRAGARGWTRLTLISNHGAEKSHPQELAELLEKIPVMMAKKPGI